MSDDLDSEYPSVQLVLRARLKDGTVIEGATREFVPEIVDVEDAHVFRALYQAADVEDPIYDWTLARIMVSRLRRAEIQDCWPDGKAPTDLIDLCLLRLCNQLLIRAKRPACLVPEVKDDDKTAASL